MLHFTFKPAHLISLGASVSTRLGVQRTADSTALPSTLSMESRRKRRYARTAGMPVTHAS